MGLRHVLEHYLRGLRMGPASLRGLPDLDGDLRDMQFESAWRMFEWDPALVVGASFVSLAVPTRFNYQFGGPSRSIRMYFFLLPPRLQPLARLRVEGALLGIDASFNTCQLCASPVGAGACLLLLLYKSQQRPLLVRKMSH